MKSILKNLTLLSMGFIAYSCNEKISPELESGNSTTIPTATVPSEYFFKVENTSATNLNYKLHRTGPSKQTSKCEVTSTSATWGALSSSNFAAENIAKPAKTDWDSKEFDISCYFEAEELALYYSGFKFEVSASPNTCAYVGYAPYSFYDQIPGDSSTTYSYVNCDDEAKLRPEMASAAADVAGDIDYDLPALGGKLGCSEYVDTGIAAADRRKRTVVSEEKLCSFNYATNKCDIGEITINDIDVAWVKYDPVVADNLLTPAVDESGKAVATITNTRTVSCGGDILNCVKGPMKELDYIYSASSTELTETEYNKAFAKEYSYDPSYPAKRSNKQYVNFRRDLANPELDFGDSDKNAVTYNPNYVSIFGGVSPATAFQPLLMDLYSYNLKWDVSTPVIAPGDRDDQKIVNGYTAEPFAAEPFLGFDDKKVNPFYTFYCFDESYEIKARIRMVVREWDRIFPTSSTSLSYISDIGSLTSSRQDYAYGQISENPGDPDGYNSYNDLADWDDYLFMTRAPAGLVIDATTLWEPKSGFFNSAIFTNGNY